ncbi:MAG: DUF1345 domain-containing protein [Chloroflexi bacterium]|nr:DUF1345 domain-containing protein [Chloroflexota bacterium]
MVKELEQDRYAWGYPAQPESRLPASLAVLAAVLLYVTLPDRYTLGPVWLFPVLELAMLLPLAIGVPVRHARETTFHRMAAIASIAIVTVANVASLVLLLKSLLTGGATAGTPLMFAAVQIWLTNVIVFALWYWELDRGGPSARCREDHREPDFLFPQMTTPAAAPAGWAPRFIDYLYVAFTNATAFSPTDTMPLTRSAKFLMTVQSIASLLTVAFVAARAVNILS